MSQLLQVGRTFRSATGIPHQFALRVYVPAEELDAVYAPLVPRALSPEEAGVNELTEQLARLAEPGQEPLPPAVEPLWTLPFSAAPRGRDMLAVGVGDFPVYHPPQRLRRSLRLVALAEEEGHHPDITFGWGYATVSLHTHKIKGLHENDFIMAAKLDGLA